MHLCRPACLPTQTCCPTCPVCIQVPDSWLPPLDLPGQPPGSGAALAKSPNQSPLHTRLAAPPSGLRSVSREGMHSVLSTPTSAAPSGEQALLWLSARYAHTCLLSSAADRAWCDAPCLLKPGRCPYRKLSSHTPFLNAPHTVLPAAVLGVSRGTSTADLQGLSEILDARSTTTAESRCDEWASQQGCIAWVMTSTLELCCHQNTLAVCCRQISASWLVRQC